MSRRLGLSVNNTSAAERICRDYGLADPAPHWHRTVGYTAPTSPEAAPTPEESVAHDREMARLKADLASVKRRYAAALKSANLHEDILEIARQEMSRYAPVEIQPPHIGTGRVEEDAILAWADWHADEVVDLDVMEGYNEYRPELVCRRAQYTVDHTLDTLFRCHVGTTFGRLWVFNLGDNITGMLLDENKMTNSMRPMAALRFLARLQARALCELSAHIPVTAVYVPGNHPRTSPKMQSKLPTENGDWLLAEMVGDLTADNERVTVVSPKAWSAVVNIRGWNHSLNHGYSAAKGGYGGIPWYSYQRTDGKLTALESAHGKRIHYRWWGHVHQKSEIPMMDGSGDQFIVGSLMGGNEYALANLSAYAQPVQKLVGVHDKMGATWRYPLDVKHADGESSRYEDLI